MACGRKRPFLSFLNSTPPPSPRGLRHVADKSKGARAVEVDTWHLVINSFSTKLQLFQAQSAQAVCRLQSSTEKPCPCEQGFPLLRLGAFRGQRKRNPLGRRYKGKEASIHHREPRGRGVFIPSARPPPHSLSLRGRRELPKRLRQPQGSRMPRLQTRARRADEWRRRTARPVV